VSSRRRGLGNLGVDVLLSAASRPSSGNDAASGELRHLPVDNIRRGKYQPRTHIKPEALQELADSIRVQGLVQPVVVRAVGEGYELIAGERRWRAAQMAGLDTIPALIKSIPDQAAAAMSLIENIQREDLKPLEEAQAFHRLIGEFDLTHQQVADAVGRSRAAVSNYLRLLDLSEPVRRLLDQGNLEMGHARALLGLAEDQQIQAARQIVAKGLSVRETERLVSQRARVTSTVPAFAAASSPDVQHLENDLSERLGARVQIQCNRKGKGRLVIQYNSLDELDGIIAHLN